MIRHIGVDEDIGRKLEITFIETVPAMMPSTVDSAKGSKCLSGLLMKSGFRM